jgi:CRP-like cAMP-binding protein
MTNEWNSGGDRLRRFLRQGFPGGAPIPADGRARPSAGATAVGTTVEAGTMGRLLANRLLGALPPEDFERLLPALEPVSLAAPDKLDDSRETPYIFFPEDAVVSHLVLLEDGSTVEAAMTGREGAVGLGAFLGQRAPTHSVRVTIPGTALRMRSDTFRSAFADIAPFRRRLLEHAGQHVSHLAQRAACTSRHRIENRLAAWLLMLHDRAPADELPLTQEFIAQRLGTRRAGVTEVACRFQQRGLLGYRRGSLRILDRPGLEAAACECYGVLRRH